MEPEEKVTEDLTQTQPPVKAEAGKLPERDFFTPANFSKFAEELGMMDEDKPPAPSKKEPTEKQPCSNCDDQGRAPIATLKVKGEDVHVYDQDKLLELAQKGTHFTQERQKDAEWEKKLTAREEDLRKTMEPMAKLAEYIRKTQAGEAAVKPEGIQADIQKVLDSDYVDPEVKGVLQGMASKIESLENQNKEFQAQSHEQNFEKARTVLDGVFNQIREEHPFDNVDLDGRNIMPELYAGVVSTLANNDQMRAVSEEGFKPRGVREIMTEAAKTLSTLEKHYQAKFSGNGDATKLTVEELTKTRPDLIESIREAAIAGYLEESGSEPPKVRTTRSDPVSDGTSSSKKKFKGLDDSLRQGLNDPDILAGLEAVAKGAPRGLK